MSSGQKKHRRITPMPVVSSFPPPDMTVHKSEDVNYTLTPEELAEVIAKYGPPKMKLSERKGHHYMESKKGAGKSGKKQIRSKKNAS